MLVMLNDLNAMTTNSRDDFNESKIFNINHSDAALKPCCCCPFMLFLVPCGSQPERSEVPCQRHAGFRAPGVDAPRPSVDCY